MIEFSKKQVVLITIVLLLVSAGVLGGIYYVKNKPLSRNQPGGAPAPAANSQQQSTDASQDFSNVRLLATGDMIAHDSINENAKKADGSYDYSSLMTDMKPYFAKGDLNFCNQSTPAGGESFGITGYPVFNAPVAFPRGIEDVGCNVVNIGTNHTNDKGQALIDATVAAWDERKVLVAGANRSKEEQDKPRLVQVKGMKFGFVAYTDYTNSPLANEYGVNRYSDAFAEQQIVAIRDQVDFVIVSMRWGTEYSPSINTRQDEVAQKLASYGADVIFGHGPHAMQPVKVLKGSQDRNVYVWYSLGNFLNSQIDAGTLIGGFASMEISPSTKKVESIGFMPVYQHYEWTAAEKAANNLLARKNFKMVPLDQSAELLAKSQLGTTVEAQMDRVTKLLNTHTSIPIIASTEF